MLLIEKRMAYADRDYARPYLNFPGFRGAVKWLIIINIAIFTLQWFSPGLNQYLIYYGAVTPALVVKRGMIWQLATYLFLHGGPGHVLFNMLALWMFGTELESTWGTRRFLQFYFFSGIGAGVCVVILDYLFSNPLIPTLGASGAIYGILLAWAVLWPDRIILFSFLFPIKVKYFVLIFGALAFYNSFGPNTGVSEVAHLGGMLFGYIFLKLPASGRRSYGKRFDPIGTMRSRYQAWKLARAKKKFQVYLKKQGRGGPYVN